MKSVFSLMFAFCILASCGTSKSGINLSGDSADFPDRAFMNKNLDLTSQLRTLPGVIINGQGGSATFQVRGANSISSPTQPLFVLNGRAYQDYSAVYRMVNSQDFKTARVLKDASETAIYGSRGANGVIIIETK